MKKLIACLCSSFLGLVSSVANADALDIGSITIDVRLNENGRIPEGVVWESSRLFTGSAPFSITATSGDRSNASIVLSDVPEIYGELAAFFDKNKKDVEDAAQTLPIALSGTTGLYLTFVGSIVGTWGNGSVTWTPNHYSEAYSQSYKTNSLSHQALAWIEGQSKDTKKGTLSFSLWPVIFCKNSGGCPVPSGSVTVKDYYLYLFAAAANDNDASSMKIIQKGTLTFKAGCEFSISPAAFSGIDIKIQGNGDILWTNSSKYSATCSRTGSLYVIFTPTAGVAERDARIGMTNLEGIGLIHRSNSTVAPTSLQQCDTWKQTKNLGTLQSTSDGRRATQGTVQWGFYQYTDVPSTGTLDASVNYEFWVE